MLSTRTFVMAGGGTGGHVIPAIAVARELERRGHEVRFIGTERGIESKLVPAAGFPIDWIEIGGLKGVGLSKAADTAMQLPKAVGAAHRILDQVRCAGVFSMGGYAAGPVGLAARWKGLPIVLMEPNAMPGLTNRAMGRFASRILVSFEDARAHFPRHKTEICGLPVRQEFFKIPQKPLGEILTILITGGSRGSKTMNRAATELWPYISGRDDVCLIHQCGSDEYPELAKRFASTNLPGRVAAFIDDMPAAFEAADIVVCRSGAGAVAELAAAGKPSIMVPYPYAADNHQLKNAEAMARAGAGRVLLDKECTGPRLWKEICELAMADSLLDLMSRAARSRSLPGAAARAATLLEELAGIEVAA